MSRIDFVTGAPVKYMALVDELSMLPVRVERAMAGRSAGDLAREPGGDEWSAARTLAHLASYSRHVGGFIFTMAWMTDPVLQPWNEDAEVEAEGWATNPAAALEVFRGETGDLVDLLSLTPDASWGRPGIHPRGGRRSLRQQVQRHIEHVDEHIAYLERVLGTSEVAASA